MKKKFTNLFFLLCLVNLGIVPKLFGQASPMPYYQDFNTSNDFTINNGTQTNKWYYGDVTGNTGKSLYISGDNGVTNDYVISTASVVQVYKDIAVPAGVTAATPATLTFDWKLYGESCCDYLRVWLLADTTTPTAGTQFSGGTQLGGNMNLQAGWQTYSNTTINLTAYAGRNVRLMFEWRNDGSVGTRPSAAIDNINFYIPTCTSAVTATSLTATNITTTSATINWTNTSPVPANGYEYYVGTSTNPPTPTTAPTGSTTANTVSLTGLTPNTNHYFWIRTVCSATDKGRWIRMTLPFLTRQNPTTLPYEQNFNTSNDFGLIIGNQVNAWSYSNLVGNGGSSLYVSMDYGISHNYHIATTSVTHAYREFVIPAGTTAASPAILSFDWMGDGQTTLDYMRVWLVPDDFMPTAGTQITAAANSRVQIGTYFNLKNTWQNYINTAVNLAPYAGRNVRLVFEWVNNNSTGTFPAAAVDNINFLIPTCKVPSVTAVNGITATNATISWTSPSPAPAGGFEYYLSTNPNPPVSGTVPTGTTTGNSINLTTLTPNTTYYWWVRSVCSSTDKSLWIVGPEFRTTQIPATIPYVQQFTTNNDFSLNNGTQVNKWQYGSATGNTGNSLYISDNGGTSNNYNITSASVVHAYRDITVPAGTTATTPATLSFSWKSEGQSGSDYMKVWVVPTSFVPTPGTQITALAGQRVQIGSNFQLQSSWQNYINAAVNLAPYTTGGVRLVFEWINNATTGTQTPAAIDNINLTIPGCKIPTSLTATNATATGVTLNWTAPSPVPANGYQYYISTTPVPPTTSTGTSATNTITINNLSPNTTYYFWVRSVCSTSDMSQWAPGPMFMTTQIPATIPYVQPFTTNDFGFINGSQTNKWHYGNVTGNPANAIYISNDGGVSNEYTITTASVVQAYRDIAIPAGSTTAKLTFDWKAVGESCCDYIRVWLVPASYMPTAGTQITAGTGRIQLGANMNQQSTWQTYTNNNLNVSSFAGQTMRLVFEWRNDGSVGTSPAAAIDNVNLLVCNNATPNVTLTNITHNSVQVNWNQDLNGASYTVQYRKLPATGAGGWTTVTVAAAPYPTPTNSTIITGIDPASDYEIEVAAVCNNTPGVFSHHNFSTKCDPTPPNIVISNVTSNSATITWAPIAASATYTFRWREAGGGWTTVTPSPQPPVFSTYNLTGLNSYTTYEVQVANQCVGSATLNPWSNPQAFTTDRVCEIAPPGLTITNITPTTAEIVWDPFPGATYMLSYRKVGISNWTNIPVNNNNYTLTGLQELTKYEMKVANVCGGSTGNSTPLYYFTTPTIVYCNMSSTTSGGTFISGVQVLPNGKPLMVNTSTASTYTDFTGNPTAAIELIQGSTNNTITINKTIANGVKASVVAWIDFNRNGIFDINEKILSEGPNNSATSTATFSVPADAFVSMTNFKNVVMRVALKEGDLPQDCTSFDAGEVEDYLVKITKEPVPSALNPSEVHIYPNPVATTLYVKNISKKANYKIYNTSGRLVSTGIILNNKIDVSNLIIGVYVIEIEDTQAGTIQKKFIKENN